MSVLERALGWFVAPAADAHPAPATTIDAASHPRTTTGSSMRRIAPTPLATGAAPHAAAVTAFLPPVAPAHRAVRGPLPPPPASPQPRPTPPPAAAGPVGRVAVLGREGDVEAVAAGLAVALRRPPKARTAVLVRLGAAEAPAPDGVCAPRRLARQLEAQGLVATARGRLAVVGLAPDAVDAARRAALVGAPTVLAVAAPRTLALDALLAEQDLVVVVADDADGPLARLTADSLAARVVFTPPLPRGPGRALARQGRFAPRALRALLGEAAR